MAEQPQSPQAHYERDGGVAVIRDAALTEFDAAMFEADFWRDRDALRGGAGGRGTTIFVAAGEDEWALRHYRRGGMAARVSSDRYVFAGYTRSRAFLEWQFLATLLAQELPVPRPVAARCARRGILYTADIITVRLPGARSLARVVEAGEAESEHWRRLGELLARFHAAGVWHADLNAHNIMLLPDGSFSLLDFDRGRLRSGAAWRARNLERLRRSLDKIAAQTRTVPDPADWRRLLSGYREHQS